MISLASLEYSQLSHFQKLALWLVISTYNLPGSIRVSFPIRLPFQMIGKNNDNSVVQPNGKEDRYKSRLRKKSEPVKKRMTACIGSARYDADTEAMATLSHMQRWTC